MYRRNGIPKSTIRLSAYNAYPRKNKLKVLNIQVFIDNIYLNFNLT